MNTIKLLVLALVVTGSLSACKRGFELNENSAVTEESANSIHIGGYNNSAWRLLLQDEGKVFTLEKRSAPNASSTEYRLTGTYETLSNDWIKMSSQSTSRAEIPKDEFYALKLSDAAYVMFPFTTLSDDWLPLVTIDDCPSGDVNGNAILLNRPSDATRSDIIWLSEFSYNRSDTRADFTKGLAINADFSEQSTITQDSGSCTGGYVARNAGHHYLGSRATLFELDSALVSDGYTRSFSLPARSISGIADIDNDAYIGMVRVYGGMEDSYRAKAECESGSCKIYEEQNDGSQDEEDLRYTLNLDDTALNHNETNGLITGELIDNVGDNLSATPVLCMVNTNLGGGTGTTKVISCSAQNPAQTTAAIQLLLSVSSS